MSFWIRDAILIIKDRKYTMDGFNFSFDVPFESSDEPPVATVKIMNLSAATRNAIQKNDIVILNAGYKGSLGCILIGNVVGMKVKQSNTDWETTLTVQPCGEAMLNAQVNKTYNEDSTASSIVRDLTAIFGAEVSRCDLAVDTEYPRGRVCRGVLKQVLTEIVVSECKSRLVVRPTGQIYIVPDGEGISSGLTLKTENGLLRTSETHTAIPVETALNSRTSGEAREDDDISRACLLNGNIGPLDIVTIQSGDLNGRFLVAKGSHKGSRTGEWKTTMSLHPL